jgi:NADH-quinone oxidoreductase subunit M
MILGILQAYPALTVVALFGAILGAAYLLGFVKQAFFGPIVQITVGHAQDLRLRELILLIVPALLVLIIGIGPQWILSSQESTLSAWLQRLYRPALPITDAGR